MRAAALRPTPPAPEPQAALLQAHTAAVPAGRRSSPLPAGWQQQGFMEIFVRAWKDSNGDGIGDLPGLISTLPYLHSLGVRGLWLMPIHPSADGDHGYAVTDYRGVHPDYGTLADFDRLIEAAHALGIGIVLDYVINHSAFSHPLFQAARSSRHSPWRDWYVWQDAHPPGWQIYGHDPWWADNGDAAAPHASHYFGAFGRHMPDFNWRHPAVAAWHHDNLRFWLNRGVDGFRFDACGHLVENGPQAWDCQPENHRLMAEVRALLDSYQHRWMVCEAPGEPAAFARSGGSAFAFDLSGHLVGAARGEPEAVAAVLAYWADAPPGMATMLSNHDHFAGARLADQLHGSGPRQRLAAASLLLGPGVPFVYYGEEIGLAGHPGLHPDPGLRTPMSWTGSAAGFTSAPQPFRPVAPNIAQAHVARQLQAPDSLLAWYRALLALRRQRVSLLQGAWAHGFVQAGGLWGFQRVAEGGQTTLVLLNTGPQPALAQPPGLPAGARLTPLLGAGDAATPLRVPALSVRVLDVQAG